jgi:membrane-associated protein
MEPSIYGLAYVENLSYIGIFLSVAFSGYAIPIPEEIILILGGFLAAQGISSLPLVIIASVLGAVFGDSVIYYLSGHGSRFTQKYHKRVEKTHLGWYLRHMKENTWLTVFFSRFIVGMRFFNPLVSGLMKVKWKTFVSATSLSALIYIPIIVLVGFYSHHQINMIIHIARSIRHLLFILFTVGTAILIVLFIRNLVQKRR